MKNTTFKNSKWTKVSELTPGMKIAVPAHLPAEFKPKFESARDISSNADITGDVLWDEIVSIKPLGREQVYDIEVEGTHNFVGNDIFAHNTYISMSGNVGIGNTAPTAKLHINDSEENSFVVTSEGRVGIGTTTPSYKLSVAGDIAATAFVNISTRTSKINIQYLTGEDEKNILEKIKSANVATYRYSIENPANPTRLGLIAEEAPAEVLSIDGKGVDIYKLSSFILAGVKAQQMQIDALKAQISNSQFLISNQTPISNDSIFKRIFTVAKSVLTSITSTIGDWSNAVLAETTKLKVASEDATNKSYETNSVLSSREEIIASGSATLTQLTTNNEQLTTGARIKFDESFIAATSETEPIKVILTPTTRLNGALYVAQKSRFGFEAREINAQDAGGMFDWLVIARKRGAEEIVTPVSPPSETPSAPIVTPEPTPTPVVEPVITPPTEPVVTPPAETPPAETVTPPAEEPAPAPPETPAP